MEAVADNASPTATFAAQGLPAALLVALPGTPVSVTGVVEGPFWGAGGGADVGCLAGPTASSDRSPRPLAG